MSDVRDDLRRRVLVAQRRLNALPERDGGEPGPPDPKTGERWDRRNVLGHTAEMLQFWTAQLREVQAGATRVGRGERGSEARRAALDTGGRPEAQLRRSVDAGVNQLLRLLSTLRPEDLARPITYSPRGGDDRRLTVEQAVDELLVSHFEEHVAQLSKMT
jgi:hypothetical protein